MSFFKTRKSFWNGGSNYFNKKQFPWGTKMAKIWVNWYIIHTNEIGCMLIYFAATSFFNHFRPIVFDILAPLGPKSGQLSVELSCFLNENMGFCEQKIITIVSPYFYNMPILLIIGQFRPLIWPSWHSWSQIEAWQLLYDVLKCLWFYFMILWYIRSI